MIYQSLAVAILHGRWVCDNNLLGLMILSSVVLLLPKLFLLGFRAVIFLLICIYLSQLIIPPPLMFLSHLSDLFSRYPGGNTSELCMSLLSLVSDIIIAFDWIESMRLISCDFFPLEFEPFEFRMSVCQLLDLGVRFLFIIINHLPVTLSISLKYQRWEPNT